MKRTLRVLLVGLALLVGACAPSPTVSMEKPVVATATPAAAPRMIMGVDRGEGLPPLIGEAQGQGKSLRVHAWVSKTELLASEQVTVFAAVERDGKPLPNAPVLVIAASPRGGVPSMMDLRAGPDGLASVQIPGSILRLGEPNQILVSVADGTDVVDVELWIFVDSAGSAAS